MQHTQLVVLRARAVKAISNLFQLPWVLPGVGYRPLLCRFGGSVGILCRKPCFLLAGAHISYERCVGDSAAAGRLLRRATYAVYKRAPSWAHKPRTLVGEGLLGEGVACSTSGASREGCRSYIKPVPASQRAVRRVGYRPHLCRFGGIVITLCRIPCFSSAGAHIFYERSVGDSAASSRMLRVQGISEVVGRPVGADPRMAMFAGPHRTNSTSLSSANYVGRTYVGMLLIAARAI